MILIFRNIIDVAALDTHLLEQSEYNDRVKIYAQRLAHQWNNIQVNDVKYNGKKYINHRHHYHQWWLTNLSLYCRPFERHSKSRNASQFQPVSGRSHNGESNFFFIIAVLIIKLCSFQIKNFVKDAAQAVNEMKVENNDELVVPFLITWVDVNHD